MRNFDQIFDDAIRRAVSEAMDDPVGTCQAHGVFTRAQDRAVGGCLKCWEERVGGVCSACSPAPGKVIKVFGGKCFVCARDVSGGTNQ